MSTAESAARWPVDVMWTHGASEIVNEHTVEENGPRWPVDLMWRYGASEIANEHAVQESVPHWTVDLMWHYGASDIANEHTREEGAHTTMASESIGWTRMESAPTDLKEQDLGEELYKIASSQVLCY